MKDTAELEVKVRKEARDRMQRVQSLGGYDAASRRWHHFRPAESLGRLLLPLSAHTSLYHKHGSYHKEPGLLLPSISSVSAKVDSPYTSGRQPLSGLQLGHTSGQTIQGWNTSNVLGDYMFPIGILFQACQPQVLQMQLIFIISIYY